MLLFGEIKFQLQQIYGRYTQPKGFTVCVVNLTAKISSKTQSHCFFDITTLNKHEGIGWVYRLLQNVCAVERRIKWHFMLCEVTGTAKFPH
jgi:hypothetical protein